MFEGVLAMSLVTYLDGNFCASDSNLCQSFILMLSPEIFGEHYIRDRERRILFLWYFLCHYFKIHDKTLTKYRNTFSKFTSFNIFQTMESNGASALFNVQKTIGISSMGLTSVMETVKPKVLLKTVCLMGLSFT